MNIYTEIPPSQIAAEKEYIRSAIFKLLSDPTQEDVGYEVFVVLMRCLVGKNADLFFLIIALVILRFGVIILCFVKLMHLQRQLLYP